jgi:hypothetical protein
MFCKVAYCRFSSTHVTKGHRCGTCGNYGHGEIECYNTRAKLNLQTFHNDELPTNKCCPVSDCEFKNLHSKEAHHCPLCKMRDPHTIEDCPSNAANGANAVTQTVVYKMLCPICREQNTITNPKKIFGLKDECCICYDRTVEILFPSCYHCCICLECLEKSQ